MHNCNNASDLVGNQLGRRGLCIIFYCCIMHSPAKAFMHYGGEIFATVRNQLPGHTTYPVIATFPQQGEGIMRSLWACQKDKNLLYNIVCKL